MFLKADGTVNMNIDCNRAKGTWLVEPSSDPSNGRFEFGPLAITAMACNPTATDEKIVKQAEYIRGYLLKDNRLYLSLMADGGIFVWESILSDSSPNFVYADPESGGPRNWETTSNLNMREQASAESNIVTVIESGLCLTIWVALNQLTEPGVTFRNWAAVREVLSLRTI